MLPPMPWFGRRRRRTRGNPDSGPVSALGWRTTVQKVSNVVTDSPVHERELAEVSVAFVLLESRYREVASGSVSEVP